MDGSHPIQSTNARTMCFYNPKICKLASSRIFRENYRRIICNSKVQFSDKDLYLNLLWGDDKDSLGGGFKASRHFRNTSVEGVMWSRQYLTLILRRLYKYTNTNTQIQLRKYKHTNTNRKKSLSRESCACAKTKVILRRLYKSSSGCGFVIFQFVRKYYTNGYICTKRRHLSLFFCVEVVICNLPSI